MKLRSRIALRIFAFNALLVFLPVAAFSLLGSYERGLVDSLEQALAQQARITAAWLGSDAEGRAAAGAARILAAAAAKRAVAAIGDKRTARFRVVDAGGRLLADSSDAGEAERAADGGRAADGSVGRASGRDSATAVGAFTGSPSGPADGASASAPDTAGGEPLLYRLFSAPARLWRRILAPPAPALPSADFYAAAGPRLLGSEIVDALAGKYGSAARVSSGGQVSVTLYSAVPVEAGGRVIGAVLVSQSTYRILRDLYAIRLDIAKVFLGSLAAAAALSLLLALTIVGPIKKLSDAAAAFLVRGIRGEEGTASFPESRRTDEIGDLQRSLRSLVLRLDERLRQTERFAADAAHEFRNPLAAIRSAAELAEVCLEPADRSRFHRSIVDDAERLRSIVDGLRRLSLAEGRVEAAARVELGPALQAACDRAASSRAEARRRLGLSEHDLKFQVRSESGAAFAAFEPAAFEVVLDNLVGNAASFARTLVTVATAINGRCLEIAVEDDGPGIPTEHLGRVFDRFFTWRPLEEKGLHTGLGLSLAKALSEAEGGRIEADNRELGGARFILTLPLSHPGGSGP